MVSAILILLFTNRFSLAQITVVSSDTIFNTNFFNNYLYNDINTANLNSVLNYKKSAGRYSISVANYYLSNVSKLGQNFFRDYNNFKIILDYELRQNLRMGVGFQNRFLTDDKNIETNKNNNNYFFANVDFRVNNNLLINTKLGLKNVDQIGEVNNGFSGIFTTEANNFLYRDYLTNGKVILFYENLVQKQNHNYEINTNIYKRFSEQTDNTGLIRFYNQRNEVYFPATQSVRNQFNVKNNIEKRIESYFQAGDYLNYLLNRDLIFSLGGFFVNRNITKEFKYRASSTNILLENVYDTKTIENNLEFSGTLNYSRHKFNSQMKLMFNERSENHTLINKAGLTPAQILELEKAERSKNNNSRRTSVLLDLIYLHSNANTFGVTGSTSLLRYDTDFDQNYDDRDERESVISTVHRYNNLLNFDVQTRFDVIISKLNYIFSQKSANNYKNTIYKLTTESNFKPLRQISTKNLVQVLANYTVYDFEDIVSQVQSFSYRQLYVKDSTVYNLSNRLSVNFQGELKYYEQGQFNNENFSVNPIAFFAEQMFNPDIFYFINDFIQIGAGYKFFEQRRYQYENSEKKLVNTYNSFGPVGKINLYLNKNSIINFTGGIDYIKYENPSQENSSVSLQLNVNWNL
ncbi:MAG: hypothetical protein SGI89_09375 [bacterium]|nr:hypothetical protein [bacterium]